MPNVTLLLDEKIYKALLRGEIGSFHFTYMPDTNYIRDKEYMKYHCRRALVMIRALAEASGENLVEIKCGALFYKHFQELKAVK